MTLVAIESYTHETERYMHDDTLFLEGTDRERGGGGERVREMPIEPP